MKKAGKILLLSLSLILGLIVLINFISFVSAADEDVCGVFAIDSSDCNLIYCSSSECTDLENWTWKNEWRELEGKSADVCEGYNNNVPDSGGGMFFSFNSGGTWHCSPSKCIKFKEGFYYPDYPDSSIKQAENMISDKSEGFFASVALSSKHCTIDGCTRIPGRFVSDTRGGVFTYDYWAGISHCTADVCIKIHEGAPYYWDLEGSDWYLEDIIWFADSEGGIFLLEGGQYCVGGDLSHCTKRWDLSHCTESSCNKTQEDITPRNLFPPHVDYITDANGGLYILDYGNNTWWHCSSSECKQYSQVFGEFSLVKADTNGGLFAMDWAPSCYPYPSPYSCLSYGVVWHFTPTSYVKIQDDGEVPLTPYRAVVDANGGLFVFSNAEYVGGGNNMVYCTSTGCTEVANSADIETSSVCVADSEGGLFVISGEGEWWLSTYKYYMWHCTPSSCTRIAEIKKTSYLWNSGRNLKADTNGGLFVMSNTSISYCTSTGCTEIPGGKAKGRRWWEDEFYLSCRESNAKTELIIGDTGTEARDITCTAEIKNLEEGDYDLKYSLITPKGEVVSDYTESVGGGNSINTEYIFRNALNKTSPSIRCKIEIIGKEGYSAVSKEWIEDLDKDGYLTKEQFESWPEEQQKDKLGGDCDDWIFDDNNSDKDFGCIADLDEIESLAMKDKNQSEKNAYCYNDTNNNGIGDYASCSFCRNPGMPEACDDIDNDCEGHDIENPSRTCSCEGKYYKSSLECKGHSFDSSLGGCYCDDIGSGVFGATFFCQMVDDVFLLKKSFADIQNFNELLERNCELKRWYYYMKQFEQKIPAISKMRDGLSNSPIIADYENREYISHRGYGVQYEPITRIFFRPPLIDDESISKELARVYSTSWTWRNPEKSWINLYSLPDKNFKEVHIEGIPYNMDHAMVGIGSRGIDQIAFYMDIIDVRSHIYGWAFGEGEEGITIRGPKHNIQNRLGNKLGQWLNPNLLSMSQSFNNEPFTKYLERFLLRALRRIE